jgi:hypothetical protein
MRIIEGIEKAEQAWGRASGSYDEMTYEIISEESKHCDDACQQFVAETDSYLYSRSHSSANAFAHPKQH